MIDISLHTHTTFSDGNNTIKEMLDRAEKLGLKTLGISDHLIVNCHLPESPSWPSLSEGYHNYVYRFDFASSSEAFLRHYEQIQKEAASRSIRVVVGAEVDYFPYPGWLEDFKKFQEKLPFEYYLSGNHFVIDENNIPINIDDVEKLIPRERQPEYIRRHFQTICQAIESGCFDFIAHIDYIRRLPICQDEDFKEEKLRVIRTLAKYKQPTELSTKGIRRGGTCFPCPWMLKELKDGQVPLLITDDAHDICELTNHFDVAEKILADIDYTYQWKPEF